MQFASYVSLKVPRGEKIQDSKGPWVVAVETRMLERCGSHDDIVVCWLSRSVGKVRSVGQYVSEAETIGGSGAGWYPVDGHIISYTTA